MLHGIVSRETRAADAAGTLISAQSTGRILLLKRADGRGWSYPGGWSEPGEAAFETAARELSEETGFPVANARPVLELEVFWLPDTDLFVVQDEGMGPPLAGLCYALFVLLVDDEFAPHLNPEHLAFTWADPTDIGPHLHPGCAAALRALRRLQAW